MDMAWSADNKYIASCGLDSIIIVWDAKKFGKVRASMPVALLMSWA